MLPYLENFLQELAKNNYSEETIYNYERDLNVFEEFIINEINKNFKNIKKEDINRYKEYLTSSNRKTAGKHNGHKILGAHSINRMLSSVKSYLFYLQNNDYHYPINPQLIKLTKTIKKQPQMAGFDELVKLIESPTRLEKDETIGLRNRAILEIFFSTGIRISELVNLNRDRVNKDGKILIVIKGKKERFVYLTDRAQQYLNKYLQTRTDRSPALFVPYRGRNVKTIKRRISTNYIQEKIKKYREILRINVPTSAHSLRHGFATYIAEKGANPVAIQILLGHESLDTTTRYVHASDRYAQQIHRKFHPLKE